jgi:hypothetical protein
MPSLLGLLAHAGRSSIRRAAQRPSWLSQSETLRCLRHASQVRRNKLCRAAAAVTLDLTSRPHRDVVLQLEKAHEISALIARAGRALAPFSARLITAFKRHPLVIEQVPTLCCRSSAMLACFSERREKCQNVHASNITGNCEACGSIRMSESKCNLISSPYIQTYCFGGLRVDNFRGRLSNLPSQFSVT